MFSFSASTNIGKYTNFETTQLEKIIGKIIGELIIKKNKAARYGKKTIGDDLLISFILFKILNE
tara:strand:- start:3666 stop:3857 length:192 start_codon:yes stop_codon:yes gene_type:complete